MFREFIRKRILMYHVSCTMYHVPCTNENYYLRCEINKNPELAEKELTDKSKINALFVHGTWYIVH